MRLFFGANLAIVLGFVLVAILVPGKDEWSHPADDELIANFAAHEQEFNELAAMAREDAGMARIGGDFLWRTDNFGWPRPESEWGITRARWDAYIDNCIKLKIRLGVVNQQPDRMLLIANARGWAMIGGTSKGYAYLVKPPEQLQVSLDDFHCPDTSAFGRYAYRPIKGNWYLYLDAC